MKLIEFDNYEIRLADEAMLVKPIRDLFYDDTSDNKETFLQQMSVVFFMKDPRSNYSYIVDEEDRLKEIIKQEGLRKNFKISTKLKDAMNQYEKLTTTTNSLLLKDAEAAVDKIRKFLREVDLSEEDSNGRIKYSVSQITSAIKQLPQISKDIFETRKIVEAEIKEIGKARGSDEKSLFEDL